MLVSPLNISLVYKEWCVWKSKVLPVINDLLAVNQCGENVSALADVALSSLLKIKASL